MKRETRILGDLVGAVAGAFLIFRRKKKAAAAVVTEELEEEVPDPEKEPGVHGSYRKWFFSLREHQVGEFAAWGVWVSDVRVPDPNPFLYLATESIPEAWFVDNAGTEGDAKDIMKAHIEAFPVKFKEELQP